MQNISQSFSSQNKYKTKSWWQQKQTTWTPWLAAAHNAVNSAWWCNCLNHFFTCSPNHNVQFTLIIIHCYCHTSLQMFLLIFLRLVTFFLIPTSPWSLLPPQFLLHHWSLLPTQSLLPHQSLLLVDPYSPSVHSYLYFIQPHPLERLFSNLHFDSY